MPQSATPEQIGRHDKIVDALIAQRDELEKTIQKKLLFVGEIHKRVEALERRLDYLDTQLGNPVTSIEVKKSAPWSEERAKVEKRYSI